MELGLNLRTLALVAVAWLIWRHFRRRPGARAVAAGYDRGTVAGIAHDPTLVVSLDAPIAELSTGERECGC